MERAKSTCPIRRKLCISSWCKILFEQGLFSPICNQFSLTNIRKFLIIGRFVLAFGHADFTRFNHPCLGSSINHSLPWYLLRTLPRWPCSRSMYVSDRHCRSQNPVYWRLLKRGGPTPCKSWASAYPSWRAHSREHLWCTYRWEPWRKGT